MTAIHKGTVQKLQAQNCTSANINREILEVKFYREEKAKVQNGSLYTLVWKRLPKIIRETKVLFGNPMATLMVQRI
jgi:hypothetical protein